MLGIMLAQLFSKWFISNIDKLFKADYSDYIDTLLDLKYFTWSSMFGFIICSIPTNSCVMHIILIWNETL